MSLEATADVVLHLGYPPSVNHYWRMVGRGKMVISDEGRRYIRDVGQRVLISGIRRPILGDLRVTIVAFPPDRRLRDIDNLAKGTLDAIQKSGLIENDNQVWDLRIVRGAVNRIDPGATVYIERAKGPE